MSLICKRSSTPFDVIEDSAGKSIVSFFTQGFFRTFAAKNSKASNPIQRHLISRCLYLLSGVAGIVARIADLAIGLIVPLPLLFCDASTSLQLFVRGPMITGIFSDIGYAIAKTINPFTLEKPRSQQTMII